MRAPRSGAVLEIGMTLGSLTSPNALAKPWNLAMEFKDSMCAKNQVILRMEICEGQEAMATKKTWGVGMPKGTAMIGRLTEPWHGTGRMVVADSYFASFLMCIWCMSWGLYFTGIVKTAPTFFPIKWGKTVEMAARRDTKTATTVKEDVTVIAHVWNDPGKPGKPCKILVSTIETTLDADPVERPRKKKDEEKDLWTNVLKFIK